MHSIIKKTACIGVAAVLATSTAACQIQITQEPEKKNTNMVKELELTDEVKEATNRTIDANSEYYGILDFKDTSEADNATKGLISAPKKLEIKDEEGNVIWSQEAYGFLDDYENAPNTVNPSLWENAKNNHSYGLFKVADGIYQVRGYDMANLTVVEGNRGWIVFDPLMSVECAKAAMELINEELGEKPISAVVISHSHEDHFGGIAGIMKESQAADKAKSIKDQISSGKIPIIVPEGFHEHAVSENILAGKAMSRRSNYQYGSLLTPGVTGRLSFGIGIAQSTGTVSYISPTYEVKKTGEKISVDGVEMEFQITPDTEAPAEMNTWFPKIKALWMAENCTGTLHNLYTLRGAFVRDGAAWAEYIMESVNKYGKDVEVVFQSHNWPHWGNDIINDYLLDTASMYQFIHDQTLTYINQGYTSDEISNMIKLPEAMEEKWYTRQYYGTVAHNAKAVYQKYMGWYDANPVNLNPLEPTESAKKWVEYLGDTDEVLRMAQEDFKKGEYQWVAEITNVLVYADPENTAARYLCADALEQLGYQAESGAWRNAYLTAALELRNGNQYVATNETQGRPMLTNMTSEMIFDYMGVLLDKQAMEEYDFKVNINVSDVKEQHVLHFRNGVLLHEKSAEAEDAKLSIVCTKKALFTILQKDIDAAYRAMQITGEDDLLEVIMENLNQLESKDDTSFNIVEP